MYSILIAVHVIISLFLIAVILLQAGKGGGLADSFGGSQMQNMFGTKSATVLTRLTAVCAIGFIATCIALAVISSHQARSIVDNVRIPQAAPASVPAEPAPK
ncbi:MAG: preprotein translocase subunit SecG [Candidatus Omnitrophota bacterium]